MTIALNLRTELPTFFRAWDWWLNGFQRNTSKVSKLPRGVRVFAEQDGRLMLQTSKGPITFSDNASARAMKGPSALLVPEAAWLSYDVTLPQASPSEQRQMAAYEIPDLTPFQERDTYFDVSRTQPGQLSVKLNIVAKRSVGSALAKMSTLDISPRYLISQVNSDQIIDLHPEPEKSQKSLIGLLALAVVLVAAWLGFTFWDQNNRFNQAQADLAKVIPAAAASKQIEARIAALKADRKAPGLLPEQPQKALVLEQLTTAIPDSAYLKRMSIEDGMVHLTGIADRVDVVVKALDQHPMFDDPRITGTLTRDADDRTRFEVTAEIVKAGS